MHSLSLASYLLITIAKISFDFSISTIVSGSISVPINPPIIVSDSSPNKSNKNSPELSINNNEFNEYNEFNNKSKNNIKSTYFNIRLSDLKCLKPNKWITDAIINAYLKYISENSSDKSIGYTNTFFLPKLKRDGPKSGIKWTGNIEKYSQFLIPVQNGCHWILYNININQGELQCYDSLSNGSSYIADLILDFFEYSSGIKLKYIKVNVPKQKNSDDCGVFLLQFAKCIYEKIDFFSFGQTDIQMIRNTIKTNLLNEIKKEYFNN